ncbi:unnamed protein product [Brassica napus]|uniref:(rape) hypothetical protein n=1 Tax=Brassica napus TaxID=3708 RepID=A0A816QZ69_BRANA|nr:unnamed protein product [Brassica napus]
MSSSVLGDLKIIVSISIAPFGFYQLVDSTFIYIYMYKHESL